MTLTAIVGLTRPTQLSSRRVTSSVWSHQQRSPHDTSVLTAMLGTDGYPYWQSAAIQDGSNVFWKSVQDVRDVVNRVKVSLAT